jgi:hypothetical protein
MRGRRGENAPASEKYFSVWASIVELSRSGLKSFFDLLLLLAESAADVIRGLAENSRDLFIGAAFDEHVEYVVITHGDEAFRN